MSQFCKNELHSKSESIIDHWATHDIIYTSCPIVWEIKGVYGEKLKLHID